jgi:hypothetical protein
MEEQDTATCTLSHSLPKLGGETAVYFCAPCKSLLLPGCPCTAWANKGNRDEQALNRLTALTVLSGPDCNAAEADAHTCSLADDGGADGFWMRV